MTTMFGRMFSMKISMTDRKGGGAYDCEVTLCPNTRQQTSCFILSTASLKLSSWICCRAKLRRLNKTDKRIMDTMFEDFDRLQEEYHEKLRQICREDGEDRG